jgi:hypothetical protein
VTTKAAGTRRICGSSPKFQHSTLCEPELCWTDYQRLDSQKRSSHNLGETASEPSLFVFSKARPLRLDKCFDALHFALGLFRTGFSQVTDGH